MKNYSQRWKINNKFVKFNDFIKTNGLDYVDYNNLTQKEKRIYNGIKTYQNRIVINGRFIDNKELTNNPSIKKFAKNYGLTPKEYIKKNYKQIKDFFEKDSLPRSLNDKDVDSFIIKHSGRTLLFGEYVLPEVILEHISMLRIQNLHKMPDMFFTASWNFQVRKFGRDIELVSVEWFGSKGRRKDDI